MRLTFQIKILLSFLLGLCSSSFFLFSCAFMPFLLTPWSVSPPVSVCGPDSGETSVGFPARDHGSLVGLMEQRKEYQLKGYKYLRAEIFNNIRVGGPRDSQDESCGMINVTRHHKRHRRQECVQYDGWTRTQTDITWLLRCQSPFRFSLFISTSLMCF